MPLAAILFLPPALALAGPFDGLYAVEGVDTSRNGQWIVIATRTMDYRARVPGYGETVTAERVPQPKAAWLDVECRAGPDVGDFPVRPATAQLLVPDHPDQRPHNWWSPMYWILGLRGADIEEVPVTVVLSDAKDPATVWHREKTVLRRNRTDYSAERTPLAVPLDGPAVMAIFARGQGIEARVRGEQTRVRGVFPAAPQLADVARKMQRDCPKAPVKH